MIMNAVLNGIMIVTVNVTVMHVLLIMIVPELTLLSVMMEVLIMIMTLTWIVGQSMSLHYMKINGNS